MENTFSESIKVKVDKKAGICHLSIKSSDYKVEVYKLSLGDMSSLISQFKGQMNTKESLSGSNENNEEAINIEE